MYSYEDRIRAVKLFIKLGKRTGPAIRQLGYPTKKSLRSWYREYEQERDLQVGYVRSKQKYSTEPGRVKTRLSVNELRFELSHRYLPTIVEVANEALHPGYRPNTRHIAS